MPADYTEITFRELQNLCEQRGYEHFMLRDNEHAFIKFFPTKCLQIVIATGFWREKKWEPLRTYVQKITTEEKILSLQPTISRSRWQKTLHRKVSVLEKLSAGDNFCFKCLKCLASAKIPKPLKTKNLQVCRCSRFSEKSKKIHSQQYKPKYTFV